MKQLSLLGGAVLLASSAVPAVASETDARMYGLVDAFIVKDAVRVPQRETGFGGRVGVGVPVLATPLGRVSIEASLFGNPINRKSGGNGQQQGLMLDLVQSFDYDAVQPFVFAGLGAVHERLLGATGSFIAIEGGAGLAYALSERFALRASISAQDVRNDQFIPGKNSFLDYRYSVGLAMPFGEGEAPPRVVDSDGDGVPDAQDACPTAPAATADGCPAPVAATPPPPPVPPKDTDGDGVLDADDACPGTLPGAAVDAHGCVAPTAQNIVLKGVTFQSNSAALTPEGTQALDQVVTALTGQPALKIEIGGHTDASGNAKKNLKLSQGRADSVRAYLVGKGIDGARLTAKGYGSSQPIADNKDPAGRAQNRRVELKVLP